MYYRILLYLHIVSVILSIGPFFAVLPIINRLREVDGSARAAYLNLFKLVVRLTMHAGHVLVVTGILLVVLGSWSWKTSWIVMTIAIMVSSLYFLARAFSPLLRKFANENEDRELLAKKLMRTTIAYVLLLLLMLWFMVIKPNLW